MRAAGSTPTSWSNSSVRRVPGYGACAGHFTANTMAVAVDFFGLGPIGLGSIPRSGSTAKGDAAEATGALVLDLIARAACAPR